MKIFFDTEFTGLHKDTTLISLGMVDENGRTFYAEFLGYDGNQADNWIKENVINNLKYKTCINNWNNEDFEHFECVGYSYFIKQWLEKWLSKYDKVELVSDVCHYDMVLFINIFGTAFDLPPYICSACYDINQDIAKYYNITLADAFDMNREELVERLYYERFLKKIDIDKEEKHNALHDAQIIKTIYNLIHE